MKVLLSLYILHNSLLRNIGEERANDEMFVAYNGPDIGEADDVLKKSVDDYFKCSRTGWHCTTNTPFKSVGITVDKKLKRRTKFWFVIS